MNTQIPIPPPLARRTFGPASARLQKRQSSIWIALILLSSLTLTLPPASAAAPPDSAAVTTKDLSELTIDELMEIRVTSVSKKEERGSQAAAAIHVISGDDIRRTGVRTIADALRWAPGIQVGQVDSHQWAISSRGFNDLFANKLLVMIDGRTVYTPLFSGVFWDVQDTFLPDIDRIEVIRGPGATLWGANAVNGVINIITRSARETQGTVLLGGGGTEERAFGGFRHGGRLGTNAFFRIYGNYFDRDSSALSDGSDAYDAWAMGRGGFRLDWDVSQANHVTLQGDLYGGNLRQTYFRLPPVPPFLPFADMTRTKVSGGNILGRWTHQVSDQSEIDVQTYYDRSVRNMALLDETRDTFDLDAHHRFGLAERHEITWGLGYRLTRDDVANSFDVSLNPHDPTTSQLLSAFVQDAIELVPDKVQLTLGSKFEHNDFTGFELQPSGRLAWTPHPRHTIWTSVSRAVRTPSRAEADIRLNQRPVFPPNTLFPGSPSLLTSIFGTDRFGSEELVAYELGYRIRPMDRLSFDFATFYNDYSELRGLIPAVPQVRLAPGQPDVPPQHIGRLIANVLEGEAYGGEVSAIFQATETWRWHASYSILDLQIHSHPTADKSTERNLEGGNPHHQFAIRSSLDLPKNWQFDAGVRYVDALEEFNIPSYLVLDSRVAWRPIPNLELSIVALNLLDRQHPEFPPTIIASPASEVEQSIYGMVKWRF